MSNKVNKVEFLLISPASDLENRCKFLCDEFKYSFMKLPSVDSMFEGETQTESGFILISAIEHDQSAAAGLVQVAKQLCPDSFIACIVGKKLSREAAAFVKKSGADVVLLEDEVYETSKLEFVCTQVIRANFFPIKVTDVVPNTVIPFDIYHFMPLRQKFLVCAHHDVEIGEEKLKKLSSVGEFYIKRSDIDTYTNYVTTVVDKSGGNLDRRCRAQYLSLRKNYSDLVILLTDQSEYGSFQKGQELLNKCRELTKDLLNSLGAIGSAWSIINNTKMGDFGSVERATAVAAYAGLFALQTGMKKIEDIMVSALLADLGLVLTTPAISKKLRDDQEDKLTAEERRAYELYPLESLKIALDRKLPIEEKMRDMIVCTHELADGSGWPKQRRSNKVPIEAQLIQFCGILDKATLVKMGEKRADFVTVLTALVHSYIGSPKLSVTLIESLRQNLAAYQSGAAIQQTR